jgi:hypothetical protein
MYYKYKYEYRVFALAMTIIILAMIFGFTISCNQRNKSVYRQAIQPPIPGADIPFDQFDFLTETGLTIVRKTGTRITIPPDAFMDAAGLPVKGLIEFRVREFHGPSDLLRAGIPMSVDSTRSGFLQSAGMIEMRAMAGGQPVEIKEGKNIEVELAGYRVSVGYHLYQLVDDKNWETTDTFSTIRNADKFRLLDSLATIRRNEHPDSARYFDIDMIMEDGSDFITQRQRTWKLAMMENRRRFNEAMRVQWNRVYIKPIDISRHRYRLEFRKSMFMDGGKEMAESYSVIATPMIAMSDTARFAADLKNYEVLLLKLDKADSMARRQADLLNRFSVNRLGIWNIDKLLNNDNLMFCQVKPDFMNEDIPNIEKIDLLMMLEDDNSVIRIGRQDWKNIPFQKGRRVSMVAVLSGEQVAFYSSKSIEEALRKGGQTLELISERISYAAFLKRHPTPGS